MRIGRTALAAVLAKHRGRAGGDRVRRLQASDVQGDGDLGKRGAVGRIGRLNGEESVVDPRRVKRHARELEIEDPDLTRPERHRRLGHDEEGHGLRRVEEAGEVGRACVPYLDLETGKGQARLRLTDDRGLRWVGDGERGGTVRHGHGQRCARLARRATWSHGGDAVAVRGLLGRSQKQRGLRRGEGLRARYRRPSSARRGRARHPRPEARRGCTRTRGRPKPWRRRDLPEVREPGTRTPAPWRSSASETRTSSKRHRKREPRPAGSSSCRGRERRGEPSP